MEYEIDKVPKFNENLAYFNEVINFCNEDNWDGYGAAKIDTSTAINGVIFIQFCECLDFFDFETSPIPGGTISFEWEYDIGSCYFEVGKEKGCFYYSDGIKEKAEPHESAYGLVDTCYDVIKNFIPKRIDVEHDLEYNDGIPNIEI